MDKELIIDWYRENGIDNVVEETTFNHFNAPCDVIKPINNNVQKLDQDTKIKNASITIENKIKMEAETIKGEKIKIQTKEVKKISSNGDNKQEFNFNYIYQNLANKYKNDNMKITANNVVSVDDAIKKARELADNSNTIDDLRKVVQNFDGYIDIKNLATNTVFSEGNPESDIMIIGEAPGNNEDLEGRPFCGQSGQLLDNMFKAIGLKREDLYITNTLFWRPPGNRTPTEEEIAICRPFVEKHISLINPKIIIFMGATALKDLIETNLTITKARRQLFDYTNQYLGEKIIKTTPLFHPSYLLRQSNKKKDAWGDLLFIQNVLDNL